MAVIVVHVAYDCLQHLTAKRKASFKQQCLYFRRNVVGQIWRISLSYSSCPSRPWKYSGRIRAGSMRLRQPSPSRLLIFGGETTVTLGAAHRRGERNQELALAAAFALRALPATLLVTLATDGTDGPTDSAGAIVAPRTIARGLATGPSTPSESARRVSLSGTGWRSLGYESRLYQRKRLVDALRLGVDRHSRRRRDVIHSQCQDLAA